MKVKNAYRRADNQLNMCLEEFVTSLIQGESKHEMCKKFDITEPTWYRWTKDEEVVAKLREYAEHSKHHALQLLEGKTADLLKRMDKLSLQSDDKRVAYNATVWLLEQIIGKATTRIQKDALEEREEKQDLANIIDLNSLRKAN